MKKKKLWKFVETIICDDFFYDIKKLDEKIKQGKKL